MLLIFASAILFATTLRKIDASIIAYIYATDGNSRMMMTKNRAREDFLRAFGER